MTVRPLNDKAALRDGSFLEPEALNGTNRLELFVFANDADGQAMLIARLDNLGKGASGAAVQNINLMLGIAGKCGTLLKRLACRLSPVLSGARPQAQRCCCVRWSIRLAVS